MAEAEYWRFTVARDCQKKNTSENHSECRLAATALATPLSRSALAGTPVGHTCLARCSEDSAGCPPSTAAPRQRMDESAKAMQQAIARSITAGSPELFQEVSRSSHAHGQAEERPRCIKVARTRSGTGGSVLWPVSRLCRADWGARGGIPLNCTQALICLRQRCQQTISKCRQGRSAPCPER